MGTSRDRVDYNPSCSTEARGSGGFVHPVPGSGVEAAEGTAPSISNLPEEGSGPGLQAQLSARPGVVSVTGRGQGHP